MPLTTEDKFQYWLSYAQNDMDSAEVMLNGGRWFYAQFMCQQAIEKLAKGIYVYNFDKEAKYTHNINLVLNEIESIANLEEYNKYKAFFDTLTSCYISGRYDTYKQELFQKFNQDSTQALLDKTKEAFTWLKSQMKL